MNIIIIDHEPYSFRKKSHYYIDEFLADGWNVQYWAVNNALDYSKNVEYTYAEKDFFVKYFTNVKDIIRCMITFDPKSTLFIIEISYRISSVGIFRVLHDHNFPWVRISYYANPIEYFSTKKTFKDKLRFFSLQDLFRKVKQFSLYKKIKKRVFNATDILFVTGTKTGTGNAKKIESLDYFDVQTYEQVKHTGPVLPYRYIVFLDVMLLSHPDNQCNGFDTTRYQKVYLTQLNALFDKIEKQTGLPIVIASHPKAAYTNEFGSRTCIKHQTAELVVHSDHVLTHGSLSISFALFAQKPLTYIYSPKFFSLNKFLVQFLYGVHAVCERLGTSKINMDDYADLKELSKHIDKDKYKKLLEELYLKKDRSASNFEILKKSFTELITNKNGGHCN